MDRRLVSYSPWGKRVNTTEQLKAHRHINTHTQKGGLIFEKLTKEKDGVKGNIS